MDTLKQEKNDLQIQKGIFAGRYSEELYPALNAIAHPTRLKILCLISQKEISVKMLYNILGTSQSNISQHLRKLKDGGVVESRREDNYMYYRIVSPVILKMMGEEMHSPEYPFF